MRLKFETIKIITNQNPQPGDVCPECDGSGYGECVYTNFGPDILACSSCGGSGKVRDWIEYYERFDRRT